MTLDPTTATELRDLAFTLSRNLMLYRYQNELSQKQFVKKCGIGSRESYRQVEIGKNVPRIETLLKIARVMGIDWKDLFVEQYGCKEMEEE